jgi:hypothetical protein
MAFKGLAMRGFRSHTESRSEESVGAERRVLVLGSTVDAPGVRAYRWDRLPPALNVADYEVAILNFTPFEDPALAEGFNLDLLPDEKRFAQLLFSDGSEIIAIGNPSLRIGPRDEMTPLHDPSVSVQWWLPIWTRITTDAGQAFSPKDEGWRFYFDLLDGYEWYFVGEYGTRTEPMYYLRDVVLEADGMRVYRETLAETRFQKPIAQSLRFAAVDQRDFVGAQPRMKAVSGFVYWLPAPTRASPDEAVERILQERYGLARSRPEPAWVGQYELPNERPIAERIAGLEQEKSHIEGELQKAHDQAGHEGRFRVMLFEKGEDVLEPVVRDALRELGADVTDPATRGKEDGRLSDSKGRRATLEIKGRTSQIRLSDVRQLGQWVSDARIEDGWDSKGLLIANAHSDTRLEDRIEEAFPPNVVQAAERSGICLLTTRQVFEALKGYQSGERLSVGFWDSLFDTDGVSGLAQLGP